MARRAMWKGVVTFGAISVPVKVYSAVREQRVNFHLLHDDDKVRLQQQMVCPVDDKPVPEEEQVKGLALDDDKYVLLDPQELEDLAPEGGRSIDVLRFVDAGHFDERFCDRGYYLGADGPAGPYEALLAALDQAGKVGLCQWVMRKRSYVGALASDGDVLKLVVMRYADEVVPAKELDLKQAEVTDKELKTARYLIDELTEKFQPSHYHDEFTAALSKLIEARAKGREPKLVKPEQPAPTASKDLLSQLEASVDHARRKRPHAKAG